ncbi:hypothetical protein [Microbulbifer sp. ARAS458-1]|uniref:hypothetical protein n=1 Tax=Microbulbifer sp. ARAS458-1 TaxID=3140242 RepID=UPI003878220C
MKVWKKVDGEKKQNIGQVTQMRILGVGGFRGTTDGQQLVARFCEAVESGQEVADEDLKAISNALSVLISPGSDSGYSDTRDRMAEVGRRLGVDRKQGNELASTKALYPAVMSVAAYLLRLERLQQDGAPVDKAQREARRTLATDCGIGERAMSNRIKKHQAEAIRLLPMLRMFYDEAITQEPAIGLPHFWK